VLENRVRFSDRWGKTPVLRVRSPIIDDHHILPTVRLSPEKKNSSDLSLEF
jgi:hypothetical protein